MTGLTFTLFSFVVAVTVAVSVPHPIAFVRVTREYALATTEALYHTAWIET